MSRTSDMHTSEQEALTEWQPIETWDRKNVWVVLFQPKVASGRSHFLSARTVMPGEEGRRESSHWMPLPAPPE